MIPVANTIAQTDTLPGEEYEATIGDPRWVMQSLADLYSNKELAVTREYSTNARDAMIEAGKADQAIEVTLPSMMDPYFKVRDYGVGMNHAEITKTYLSFGNSTKRESNNFNGILGFGSKSAIAYTETFTVTSVKEGRKIIAVITRKADYSIVLKVVSDTPSDESNGTEVVVPVHNWQEFTHKARDFYRFWFPGTVLVNGEFPAQAVGEKISDNFYYSEDYGTSYVVMGNVGYRIENAEALFRDKRIKAISFVAYVDTCTCEHANEGEPHAAVEFTPAREALKYTDHTKATLHKVIRDFEEKILTQAKNEIANAEDHFDAYSKWSNWTARLGRGLFTELEYDGDKLTEAFPVSGTRYRVNAYGYSTQHITNWNVNEMYRTLIITDFTPILGSHHKAKVREYAGLKNLKMSYAIFTPQTKVDSVWVDQARVISWEDLKAALPKKAPKPRVYAAGPKRIPGTFDYWTKDGKVFEKQIPEGVTVYYVRAKEVRPVKDTVLDIRSALSLLDDNGVVVLLAANRVEKFQRDNPTAIDFLPHFQKKVVIKAGTLVSDDAKRAMSVGYAVQQWMSVLDVTKIDDPAFKEMRDLINRKGELMKPYQKNEALAIALNMRYNVERYTAAGNTDDRLIAPYPLLSSMRTLSVNKEHIYLYMNAVYSARKDNK